MKTDVTKLYSFQSVHNIILIYFYGETRTRKWFTPAQTPRDREMILEVFHDLEKWSLWKLVPPFGLINIRFYVSHLMYLHVPGISVDSHRMKTYGVRKRKHVTINP